jgi:cobalt-precorrin-5B (C1)-methyltransferase
MSETDHDSAASPNLRRGWTTGTCATAATRAAYMGLVTGTIPDWVPVLLPNGSRPTFAIASSEMADGYVRAAVVKDAGDDPDVTHGALIVATVRVAPAGSGISFKAGVGVGTVTKPGLVIAPGEPAINPVPRDMMRIAIAEAADETGGPRDIQIEISIPNGEALAQQTLNPRLGIVGGLSILGTTGVVVPFSCAAWIASIHRGIDVARAEGIAHVAGATGHTSEKAIQKFHALPDVALIDMGDFAGGMLKYLRTHPVQSVTVGGGFAKMTKLGQGLLDLHSKRGEIDREWLAERVSELTTNSELIQKTRHANTALEVLTECRAYEIDIASRVAEEAWKTAAHALSGSSTKLDVVIVDRNGAVVAKTPARAV